MSRKILGGVVLVSAIAAGCGPNGEDGSQSRNESGEIPISMTEFGFGTDAVEVTAGETVTFVIVNEGAVDHEFMIGRNVVETADGAPNGFEHDFFETVTPTIEPENAGMFMGAMSDDMDMSGDDMDMSGDEMSDDDMDMSDDDMDMSGDDMSDDMDMSGDDMSDDMDMSGDDMSGDDMSGDDMSGDDMSDDMDMSGDDMSDDMDMSGDDMSGGEMEAEEGHAGYMVARRQGETARLTVTIPEDAVGEWQIGCFEGDGSHWSAGMRATLIVADA